MQWGSSAGSLNNICSSFEGSDLTTGYAGIQVDLEGKHTVIMSIWDTFCTDKKGNRIKIRPNIIYPDVSKCRGDGTCDGEGTGVGCAYDFDWKVNHPYRALFQHGQAPNGNATIVFWLYDLETKQWHYLFEYEINRTNTRMMYGSSFLENFDPGHAGEVRSIMLSNIRVLSPTSGGWIGVNNGYLFSSFNLPGSYIFGSEGSAFWFIITEQVIIYLNLWKKSRQIQRNILGFRGV